MGLFDKFRKKAQQPGTEQPADTGSPQLIDLLSAYLGPSRQRQLAFGEQVVRERDWNVDFSEGAIYFGDDKYPAQLLGTQSDISDTWLWGFENPSDALKAAAANSRRVYDLCKVAPELASRKLDVTELVNGHNIASIAAASSPDRTCYYRCPYDGGAAFVTVGNIPESVFAPTDPTQTLSIIMDLISQFPLSHRILVKSLLAANCGQVEDNPESIIGHYPDGQSLIASFDAQGRLTSIQTDSSDESRQLAAGAGVTYDNGEDFLADLP